MFLEDVKHLNEKLTETNNFKMDLQLKLDDMQSSEASVQVHTRFQTVQGSHGSSLNYPFSH